MWKKNLLGHSDEELILPSVQSQWQIVCGDVGFGFDGVVLGAFAGPGKAQFFPFENVVEFAGTAADGDQRENRDRFQQHGENLVPDPEPSQTEELSDRQSVLLASAVSH